MEHLDNLITLVDEIVETQKTRVLKSGRQIIPNLTTEDVLQPNDYPQLENNPIFRYEEGILEGVQTIQMALRAYSKEQEIHVH